MKNAKVLLALLRYNQAITPKQFRVILKVLTQNTNV